MDFKAKNNSNTTGAQWKEKYEYKSKKRAEKKWLTRHYNEIKNAWKRMTNGNSRGQISISPAAYAILEKALNDARGYLEALRGDAGTSWKGTWDDLAETWNLSIIVKRYFAGKVKASELEEEATYYKIREKKRHRDDSDDSDDSDDDYDELGYPYKLKFKF